MNDTTADTFTRLTSAARELEELAASLRAQAVALAFAPIPTGAVKDDLRARAERIEHG